MRHHHLQSPESERRVLGALVLGESWALKVLDLLAPDDFTVPNHRAVFAAAQAIRARGEPVDEGAIAAEMVHPDARPVSLTDLAEAAVTSEASLDAAVVLLREKGALRRGLRLGDDLQRGISNGTMGLGEASALITANSGLSTLSRRRDTPVCVRVADVEREPTLWLWSGLIPLGKLTLLAGDPGLGKSVMTLAIAARVSRGEPLPNDTSSERTPGSVVILSAEDDLADTIRPRLEAAGADLERVHMFKAIRRGNRECAFDLTRDLAALESAIVSLPDCRLCVIDPVSAFLPGIDGNDNGQIRGVLAPLAALAARTGVAVLIVSHLNKARIGPAICRTMGSLGLPAAARVVMVVCRDKNDPDRRLLLLVKNNLAPDVDGRAFRVLDTAGQPRIDWEPDPVYVDADDALNPTTGGSGRSGARRAKVDDAEDWLRGALAAGPRPAKEVEAEGVAAGFSEATLRRARTRAGVKATRHGFGERGEWDLSLPAQPAQPPPTKAPPEPGEQLWATPEDSGPQHQRRSLLNEESANGHSRPPQTESSEQEGAPRSANRSANEAPQAPAMPPFHPR